MVDNSSSWIGNTTSMHLFVLRFVCNNNELQAKFSTNDGVLTTGNENSGHSTEVV